MTQSADWNMNQRMLNQFTEGTTANDMSVSPVQCNLFQHRVA